MTDLEWTKIRNAIRKRLQAFVRRGHGACDLSALDDATQDAVIRCASLIGKGMPIGKAVVIAASREVAYCRSGAGVEYRPAFEPANRERWEEDMDTGRMVLNGHAAPLSWQEIRERGLVAASVERLQAGIDR